MKNTFEKCLCEQMKINKRIVSFFADSDFGFYEELKKDCPDRFFNFGIAESNMVAAAAGMAQSAGRGGVIPVVYTVGAFLTYRAYEFIRTVCIQKLNVKLVGMGAGVKINNFGPTHHATEDIAILRVLPNLVLLSPASPKEAAVIFEKSLEYDSAVYIRLGKAFETEIYNDTPNFEIGKSTLIQAGDDITIISTGSIISNVLDAAAHLKEEGINADIINMTTLKPIDEEGIIRSAQKTGRVVTVEEHQIIGGPGSAVSEVLCSNHIRASFERLGFRDTFCTEYGWHRDLLEFYGMSPSSIFNVCKNLLSQ
ncbi:MAG: transketolase family protein [Treponema sp.]|jgi:transketolase|nr:transketolase family protein [Treponema sp.]